MSKKSVSVERAGEPRLVLPHRGAQPADVLVGGPQAADALAEVEVDEAAPDLPGRDPELGPGPLVGPDDHLVVVHDERRRAG